MASIQNLVNNVKSKSLQVAEYFTPLLKESKFHETGVLTPEEFVAAGDHLSHHCPSWRWATGDPAAAKDYLPKEKQFLVTRNVPCYRRCAHMLASVDGDRKEKLVEGGDGGGGADDGWVDTHHFEGDQVAEKVKDMSLDEEPAKTKSMSSASASSAAAPSAGNDDEDSDQEAVDMEDFIDSGMMEREGLDEGTLDVDKAKQEQQRSAEAQGAVAAKADEGGEIVATRTYDLMITYDKFYQTPRLWLTGYDEQRRALSVDEMYEDFSADHANKTITMEAHPHLPDSPPQASVHPCRHAAVMKKLIDQIMEGGGELGVHMYLIVFLKFVQAIIPTIEYDFTQNFAL
jgi:ubiquitin-like-conjugating enzyme ATG3